MGLSKLDKVTAERTIKIKNCNYCLSFVTLVWRGELIMCCYNNLSKALADLYTGQVFSPEEFADLEEMIGEYIFGEYAKIMERP